MIAAAGLAAKALALTALALTYLVAAAEAKAKAVPQCGVQLTAPCVPTVYAAASSAFAGPARPTAVLAARATAKGVPLLLHRR